MVRRGKISISIIVFGIVIYVFSIFMLNNRESVHSDSVENALNEKIDSLLAANGFKGATLSKINGYKMVTILPPILEEDTLFFLKMKYETADRPERIVLAKNIERLTQIVEDYKYDPANGVCQYNRRLDFLTAEGVPYTCVQVIDTNLQQSTLKHIIPTEKE